MTVLIICVYALNRNKRAELYIQSMFQTSDIELLSPKLKLNIHHTKSPKCDHICHPKQNDSISLCLSDSVQCRSGYYFLAWVLYFSFGT